MWLSSITSTFRTRTYPSCKPILHAHYVPFFLATGDMNEVSNILNTSWDKQNYHCFHLDALIHCLWLYVIHWVWIRLCIVFLIFLWIFTCRMHSRKNTPTHHTHAHARTSTRTHDLITEWFFQNVWMHRI